jgi:hypothetical protein
MNSDANHGDSLGDELRDLMRQEDLVQAGVDAITTEIEGAEAVVMDLLGEVVEDPNSYISRLGTILVGKLKEGPNSTPSADEMVGDHLRAFTILVPNIDGMEVMSKEELAATKDELAFASMRDYGMKDSEPLRSLLDILRPDLPLASKLTAEDLKAHLVRQIPKEHLEFAELTLRDLFVAEIEQALGLHDDLRQISAGCLKWDASAIRKQFEADPSRCGEVISYEMYDQWETALPPDYLNRFRLIRLDHAAMLIGLLSIQQLGGSTSSLD